MNDGLPSWRRTALAWAGGVFLLTFCGLKLFHELLNEVDVQ